MPSVCIKKVLLSISQTVEAHNQSEWLPLQYYGRALPRSGENQENITCIAFCNPSQVGKNAANSNGSAPAKSEIGICCYIFAVLVGLRKRRKVRCPLNFFVFVSHNSYTF